MSFVLFGKPLLVPQWSLTSEWPRLKPTPLKMTHTRSPLVPPDDGARRQFRSPNLSSREPNSDARRCAYPLHPTHISTVHEFTSGGHQAGFTTGQQKHVILSRTPYLGVYVRENQVHVLLISIIHHKLCRGALERANPSRATNQVRTFIVFLK